MAFARREGERLAPMAFHIRSRSCIGKTVSRETDCRFYFCWYYNSISQQFPSFCLVVKFAKFHHGNSAIKSQYTLHLMWPSRTTVAVLIYLQVLFIQSLNIGYYPRLAHWSRGYDVLCKHISKAKFSNRRNLFPQRLLNDLHNI